jgi:hypothetical protein
MIQRWKVEYNFFRSIILLPKQREVMKILAIEYIQHIKSHFELSINETIPVTGRGGL